MTRKFIEDKGLSKELVDEIHDKTARLSIKLSQSLTKRINLILSKHFEMIFPYNYN